MLKYNVIVNLIKDHKKLEQLKWQNKRKKKRQKEFED